MTLTELPEFLLAQIAEDETVARDALDRGFGGWEHFADRRCNAGMG